MGGVYCIGLHNHIANETIPSIFASNSFVCTFDPVQNDSTSAAAATAAADAANYSNYNLQHMEIINWLHSQTQPHTHT